MSVLFRWELPYAWVASPSPPESLGVPLDLRRVRWAVAATSLFAADSGDSVDFNRDVRPILADKCFACHGPDHAKREADLRLDQEASAKDQRGIIVPGQPEESELLRRVLTEDADERMPPGSTKKSLTEAEVTTLRRWIAPSAPWQEHWSLLPPRKATPPDVEDPAWSTNAIDRFVWDTARRHNLTPAEVADRRTLLRRLSFDLTGLPPTPQEVDQFLANTSPDAYERTVDRLLRSPHFGERMAVYWLDVVRYADSGGYHSDNHRDVASYRDYVIAAFNENLPFDQFTAEQIAGDLLPKPTTRQLIASGYNRLLQTTEEGGAQPKEYTAKYLADRVRNTSTAWMGITMGCCECHNHKFDPFTMQDFYGLGAFFADVQERPVGRQQQTALPTPDQERQLADLEQQLSPWRERFQASPPEYLEGLSRWTVARREEVLAGRLDWSTPRPASVASAKSQTLEVQDDQSVLASGQNPVQDTYTITLPLDGQRVAAVRVETLTHDSLTKKSLSRANGNFVLTGVEAELVTPGDPEARPLAFKGAVADFSQDGYPVAHAIDGDSETGWAVDGHNRAANHQAMFLLADPVKAPAEASLVVRLKHESRFAQHNIGRFRLAISQADEPLLEDGGGLPAEVVAALRVESEQRDAAQRDAIDRYYRDIAPELVESRDQVRAIEAEMAKVRAAFPQTLVSMSGPPREVRVLPRGNWLDDSGELVAPATPASLPSTPIEDRRLARLELARWLASRENPLAARVYVNRVWKLFFGQGIVKTLDDLGTQGAAPTHPELLDWLAVEFMDSGWDTKHLIKSLVMSRAYQQSSQPSAEALERDPGNRWLARQARFRLDAELVRDNALAVSGLLSPKVGGPSVKPYQPAGYWQHLNFPKREWKPDTGDDLYRRGLYTYWQRSFLHPSLLAFDAPSREECTVERPRSNTPLQALVLLNDPTYVEAARGLAARVLADGGEDDAARLNFAMRCVLNRDASERERHVLRELLEKHRGQFASDPDSAAAVLGVGEESTPTDVEPAELAAWTSVTRTILNLHETITRY